MNLIIFQDWSKAIKKLSENELLRNQLATNAHNNFIKYYIWRKESLSKILSINDKTRYVLYILILLFMYSVKYKIDNQPKIVPFF